MVTITNFSVQENKKEGKPFIKLDLQSEPVMIQSMQTGKFYVSCRKCSISSTFSEEEAKQLIGKQLPGTIERVSTVPYDYTVPDTGEVISLSHTYEYLPEEVQIKPLVRQKELV